MVGLSLEWNVRDQQFVMLVMVSVSYWAKICCLPFSMLICLLMLVVRYFCSLWSDCTDFSSAPIHFLRLPLPFLLSPESEEP